MVAMRVRRWPVLTRAAALAAGAGLVLFASGGSPITAAAQDQPSRGDSSTCKLPAQDGAIKHVVNIVFDNTHFTRDDPNVPSDLEQMPNLLNFLTGNGTLLSHEHTPLISHTGTDILTSLTGQYGSSMGAPVSNSFGFYDTNAKASFRSVFAYWTARLGGRNDNSYFMVTPDGKNAPAPWVPFTRAGCSYGAAGTANLELENTGFDVPLVFGKGSPEDVEQSNAFNIPCGFGSNPPCTPAQQKAKNQPSADFVGVAIHCARTDAVCNSGKGVRPDLLPDEPGGYGGFNALYGAKYTDPVISPNGPVKDLNGNVIQDATGNVGFPGFDGMFAATSLGYVTQMLEAGVPIATAYISDAHDNHAGGNAFGPGEAGYVAQLKAYDDAFGKFFARLGADGINKSNTLFTVTADEGDHFAGGQGSPAGCDGIHTPCTYSKIGEVDANLSGLLAPVMAPAPVPNFSVHSDSAPTVYIYGNPGQQDQTTTRPVERASAHIQAVNPITGETDHVTNFLAGAAEMRNLHMLTGDPARNPTFTLFAKPDYFLCAFDFTCTTTLTSVEENPGFAWNHGDVAPEINNTWFGIVGPGVRHLGVGGAIWSDHANDRPTLMAALGLKDDYRHDGRVVSEILQDPGSNGDRASLEQLGRVFNQLNASVGQFGLATLAASTAALESGTNQNDSVYTSTSAQLTALGQARDQLVAQMAAILDRPVSTVQGGGHEDAAGALGNAGFNLLQQAWLLAGQ